VLGPGASRTGSVALSPRGLTPLRVRHNFVARTLPTHRSAIFSLFAATPTGVPRTGDDRPARKGVDSRLPREGFRFGRAGSRARRGVVHRIHRRVGRIGWSREPVCPGRGLACSAVRPAGRVPLPRARVRLRPLPRECEGARSPPRRGARRARRAALGVRPSPARGSRPRGPGPCPPSSLGRAPRPRAGRRRRGRRPA
jgi:hypothetical protein